MEDTKRILELLFDPEDQIVVSDGQWSYHAMPQASLLSGEVTLVSPNNKIADRIVKTENLPLLVINAIKGFRKDTNVTKHRTFLWENDTYTLDQQKNYVKDLGIPFSLAVYSGNKSIHYATVLEEPIDYKTYKTLYLWALKIGTFFDKNCKNPSRSIRMPGVIRSETGKAQELIELKGRVKLSDFMAWLNKYEHLRPIEPEYKKGLTNEKDYNMLSPWALKQLKYGIKTNKGRNQTWFGLFCDFAKAGYSKKEATDILYSYYNEEPDFKLKEWLIIAQSAYNKFGR